MKKKTYDILSPDGFTIFYDKTFKTIEEAKENFTTWLKNYEKQGYYSSVSFGRIDLRDVWEYCQLIEL